MMRRHLISLILAAFMSTASACWFQRISYNDYVSGINSFERHTIAQQEVVTPAGKRIAKTTYTVTNNQVVDFPLTVISKIVSDAPVYASDETKKPEVLRGQLQYRVLPDGNWVTIEEFEKPTGTIPMDVPPQQYFGKNNIMPMDLKRGDVIMVRMYLTDGVWQTGDIESMCDAMKSTAHQQAGEARTWTLADTIGPYEISEGSQLPIDLGGGWAPHYVMTVIFSGNYRPSR